MTKPASHESAHKPTPQVDGHVTAPAIEILRVGTFVDMHGREHSFSAQDLADIAGAYDPSLGEAPLVLGHPETNAPAYGWVRELRVEGDRLVADTDQVDAKFADMVRAGRFKKRSASFYGKTSKNNPAPGKAYLRHVGFLGAAVPAATGLRDANFAGADDDCIEFSEPMRWTWNYVADVFRRLRDRLIETDGLEKADSIIPSYQVDSIRDAAREQSPSFADPAAATSNEEDPDMTAKTAEFAERERELAEREERIAAQERTQAEAAATALRNDAASFADGLVGAGKLLPAQKATVVELLLALPDDAPLSFADGDDTVERPACELMRELLEGLPQRIDFSEKSGGGMADGTASFAAPQGALVDAGQLSLHTKARAYQAEHPGISIIDAAKAVGG